MTRMLVLALILPMPPPVLAASDDSYEFGVHLLSRGDDFRAITELERFLFRHPGSPRGESALWMIGTAYYQGGHWKSAAERFEEHHQLFPDSPRALQARFFQAEALFQLSRREIALPLLRPLLADRGLSQPMARFASLRLASMLLLEGHLEEGSETLRQAAEKDPDPALGEQMRGWAVQMAALEAPPRISPWMTGLSSAVIPGSGQAMAGYPKEGFSAFVLIGGFAAWALGAYANKMDGAAWTLASIGSIFYLGNIQSAINAALRKNQQSADQPRLNLLNELDSLNPPEPSLGLPE